MQAQSPYQDFLKLSTQKQLTLIQQQTQTQPKQILDISTPFPDQDFIELYGKQNKKAIKLATYRYPTQGKPKGLIVGFHTMNMCAAHMIRIAKTFANNGFVFTSFDMRGHGRSEGQRGYFDDYKEVLKDCNNFIEQVTKIYPQIPLFYLANGSGSLIAIVATKQLKFKVAGMILASPALKKPGNSKVLSAVSDVALKLMPSKTGLFQPDYSRLVKNPTATQYMNKDKLLNHEKVAVGTLMQMMGFMKKNQESSWKKLATPPIVIIQGQYDKVADPINSINFYESITTKDKQFIWMPKMWNYFYLQQQYEEVEGRIMKWITERV